MSTPSAVSFTEKWRKPASLLFVLLWLGMALFLKPAGLDTPWYSAMELTGFTLLIVAALGRLWSYAYIGGRKNQQLCMEGPYAMTRNPLYLFSFIGILGASLAIQSPLLCVISTVFFLAYYKAVILAEETRLGTLFGQSFADYCTAVPRFWPKFAPVAGDDEITLPAKLFNRTLREVFWFLAAIVVIELIESGKIADAWPQWPTPF